MAQAKKSTATKTKTKKKKSSTPRASSARRPTPEPYQKSASIENYTGRVTAAVILLFLTCLVAVSYFVNEGMIILAIREFIGGVLGYGYWACAVCMLWAALLLFKGGKNVGLRAACILLIPFFFSCIIDVFSYRGASNGASLSATVNQLFYDGQQFSCGGVFSGVVVMALVSLLSQVGTGIVIVILLVICVALAVSEPDNWFLEQQDKRGKSGKGTKAAVETAPKRFSAGNFIRMVDNEDPLNDPLENGELTSQQKAPSVTKAKKTFVSDIPLDDSDEISFRPAENTQRKAPSAAARKNKTPVAKMASGEPEMRELAEETTEDVLKPLSLSKPRANKRTPASAAATAAATDSVKPLSIREAQSIAGIPEEEPEEAAEEKTLAASVRVPVSSGRKAASTKADMKEEKITHADIQKEAKKVAAAVNAEKTTEEYVYPRTDLLAKTKAAGSDSRDEILETKERLENTLHSFGINSSVIEITHGPTVTRYDIELEQGVKLTKVTNLASDIALSLGASNVRIAPIPDKISTVGIEVPNKIVNTVGLRELIESDNFQKAKSRLSFAIGKDIAGNAIVGNISKLPHMLIAGTTGSGKSVCMNSLILSLLYKARPDEVKFIMIDPKMVELGIYNSIPHLYVPVVTDPKKAAGALQWAVVEMLKRYRLFSEAGVRDLETYNKLCQSNGEETLPQVVIVIDELADLMMAASKEVEESICRIAQMGRAASMHLVIATQRPSADVITGLMKANIPSRIAFAVSSSLESRIILDQAGAEKLIGHGDMLYAPIGCGKPLRVQGAFVSDEERERIINFISDNSSFETSHNDELSEYMNKALESKNGNDASASSGGSAKEEKGLAGEYDEMLPQAAEVVLEMKQCSVSMLQRRLKLGYSRAARIVDQLEELGIVGPYEGAKPRSVPIDRNGWNEIQVKLGLASADDFALAAEMNESMEEEPVMEEEP